MTFTVPELAVGFVLGVAASWAVIAVLVMAAYRDARRRRGG